MSRAQRERSRNAERERPEPTCEHCGRVLFAMTANEFWSRCEDVPGADYLRAGVVGLAQHIGPDALMSFCGPCGCFAAVGVEPHGAHS